MIVVAIIRVNQVNSQLPGFGAAIAQWPTVFAAEANGKLNDQHEIVNGRRRVVGQDEELDERHHGQHGRQADAESGDPVIVQAKPRGACRRRRNHQYRQGGKTRIAQPLFGHQPTDDQRTERHPEVDTDCEQALRQSMPAVGLQRNTRDERAANDRQRESRMYRVTITRSCNPICYKGCRADSPHRGQPRSRTRNPGVRGTWASSKSGISGM